MNRLYTSLAGAGLASLVALTVAAGAHAQPTPQEKALAQGLFDDGRKLMDAGKIAEACGKLAESQRLDPSAGTLLNLAICHEKEGKIASAWAEYKEAATLSAAAGRQDRAEYAQKKGDAVEAKLSRLVVEISAPVSGMVLRLDQKELKAIAAAGSGMPLDPGEHLVEVTAPGKKAWSGRVTVEPGPSTARVVVPELAPAPAEKQPDGPNPVVPEGGNTGWRAAGIAIGGLGVAGIGVGAVFGGLTLSKAAEVQDLCGDAARCNSQAGVDANNTAKTMAMVSNIAFAAGAACAAAGVVVLVTLGSSKKQPAAARKVWAAPQIGANAAHLTVGGQW